jgi:hypothetical protein
VPRPNVGGQSRIRVLALSGVKGVCYYCTIMNAFPAYRPFYFYFYWPKPVAVDGLLSR